MHRRKWDAKPKAMIVIEGLKGKLVAELCTEHQISQAQYYHWRDQFPVATRVEVSFHLNQCPREVDRRLQRALSALNLGQQAAQAI